MHARPSADNPMLLFGCGNMGRAMLDGWLRDGVEPAAFAVVDPKPEGIAPGVRLITDSQDVPDRFSLALLAIKPQMFAELAPAFARLLTNDAWVLSILAGTQTAQLQAHLPGRTIVRVMPNLAAAIGKAPLGLFAQPSLDRKIVDQLVSPLGTAFWLDTEDAMDAVTALAGSGPAFVYRFIDAFSRAGAALGLKPEQAEGMALSMVEGAALLAAGSHASPTELARRVTSPGGTTAAGLALLDQDEALNRLMYDTLRAARDRGRELAQSSAA